MLIHKIIKFKLTNKRN